MFASYNGPQGPWFGICKAMKLFRDQGLDFQALYPNRIGDDTRVDFWHDIWSGDLPLKLKFHMVFALDLQKIGSVAARISIGW